MENEFILSEEKTYIHQETKELLEEVRGFFQGKLKMIGIEWISDKKNNEDEENGIHLFVIEKANRPLYESCNGFEDVDKLLDQFKDSLENLLDSFDALIDNNKEISNDSRDSLESYADAAMKGITRLGIERKRRNAIFKAASTVEELREHLKDLIADIIVNYIILVLIDALYERIKNNAGEVYTLAVNEINKFLVENGVYTKEIVRGETIDPEFIEPTSDSCDNVTDDFQKFDTIDEIRRYPYLFTDGTKIFDGSARIWRRKD